MNFFRDFTDGSHPSACYGSSRPHAAPSHILAHSQHPNTTPYNQYYAPHPWTTHAYAGISHRQLYQYHSIPQKILQHQAAPLRQQPYQQYHNLPQSHLQYQIASPSQSPYAYIGALQQQPFQYTSISQDILQDQTPSHYFTVKDGDLKSPSPIYATNATNATQGLSQPFYPPVECTPKAHITFSNGSDCEVIEPTKCQPKPQCTNKRVAPDTPAQDAPSEKKRKKVPDWLLPAIGEQMPGYRKMTPQEYTIARARGDTNQQKREKEQREVVIQKSVDELEKTKKKAKVSQQPGATQEATKLKEKKQSKPKKASNAKKEPEANKKPKPTKVAKNSMKADSTVVEQPPVEVVEVSWLPTPSLFLTPSSLPTPPPPPPSPPIRHIKPNFENWHEEDLGEFLSDIVQSIEQRKRGEEIAAILPWVEKLEAQNIEKELDMFLGDVEEEIARLNKEFHAECGMGEPEDEIEYGDLVVVDEEGRNHEFGKLGEAESEAEIESVTGLQQDEEDDEDEIDEEYRERVLWDEEELPEDGEDESARIDSPLQTEQPKPKKSLEFEKDAAPTRQAVEQEWDTDWSEEE